MRDFALVLVYFTDDMVRMYICCNIVVQSDFCDVNEETKKDPSCNIFNLQSL